MRYATDFRRIARDSLKGKWGVAILAGLLASLLGVVPTTNFSTEIDLSGWDSSQGTQISSGVEYSESVETVLNAPISEETRQMIIVVVGMLLAVVVIGFALAIALSIVGSVVRLGYIRFNLDLISKPEKPEVTTLLQYFRYWKAAFCAAFLENLYVLGWALLFIIPGIVAGYSYAMTGYILAEEPDLRAREAIARSKEMMSGNRWRLFCLEISFIGWDILCLFTAGIGNLWLTPYKQAAYAAFYREISGRGYDQNLLG